MTPATKARKQESLIVALCTSATLQQAYMVSGVPERTARDWRAKPAFEARVQAAIALASGEAKEQLRLGMRTTVDTLLSIATDGSQQSNARVTACRTWLDSLIKFESIDLEKRVLALETAALEMQREREREKAYEQELSEPDSEAGRGPRGPYHFDDASANE